MKEDYKNKTIVIDTSTSWTYIGTFYDEDENHLVLDDADAFDLSEISLSKQEYLIMVKKDGIVPNRKRVKILKSKVVAISFLNDVIEK